MKMRILFVDDEQNVLEGLRRMLRPMRDVWEMSFAQNGQEALALMQQMPYAAVISDMRMPGMDGVALLTEVKKHYPQTIRFVLSGQNDNEAIFRAISPAHQYLSKPTDPQTIKDTLERALALRTLLGGENLKQLISQIRILPSVPQLYFQVVEELHSPDASLRKVGECIERDLGMSAKVLQLVNSAFFGLPQKVASPSHAVNMLGLEIIRSLVLVFGVFAQFKGLEKRVPGFSLEALQQHSLAVATYAREIGKQQGLGKVELDDIYMAGLFHDLGKLVLLANMTQRYVQALTLARSKKAAIVNAEWAAFGATHAEVGAYLLGLWGFSNPVIEATAFHHQPAQRQSSGNSAITAVHVADAVAHEIHAREDVVPGSQIDVKYLGALGLQSKLTTWRELCHSTTV